jgi:hypothetical protein
MSKFLMAAALALLTTLAPAYAAFDPNRIVTTVDDATKTFSCQADRSEPIYTYKTTSKTRIRVSGKRIRVSFLWDEGNFSEIKVGAVITVQYHIEGGERIAERVTIYPKMKPQKH